MSFQSDGSEYLIAATEAGLAIIHGSPATLNWVPRDIVNDVYNLGGTVTVGTFDCVDEAKRAASEQYSVLVEDWQSSDLPPFNPGDESRTEIHTPEIDGHTFSRHSTRWK